MRYPTRRRDNEATNTNVHSEILRPNWIENSDQTTTIVLLRDVHDLDY